MKLTIVTPTYNQGQFIKRTFDSILDQDIRKDTLEYILVDALSNDGTKEIVKSYVQKFHKKGIKFMYIREKDKGQSDAINKGWEQAGGDVVTYINSDDYYEHNALSRVLKYFDSHRSIQWAYGGWNLVNKNGQVYSTVMHKAFNRNKLLNYCNIGQPSCFFRKKLLRQFGYLDSDLHLAFDYDLWLRFTTKYDAGMIPGILSNMRYYAEAKSAVKTYAQLQEMLALNTRYTSLVSIQRMTQCFFYLRGFLSQVLKIDISNRIKNTENA